jgi:hypothetical protein
MKRNKIGQFTSKGMEQGNNPKWKGNKVGYFGLHSWVQRKLGIAKKCSNCNSIKNVQWANISRKYKRDLFDWKQLCSRCHKDFDAKIKNIESIRSLYLEGKTQIEIASIFNIHQTSVSLIVNRKGALRYV